MKRFILLTLYYLPYLAIMAVGAWYRLNTSPVAFLDGDSTGYMLPGFVKILCHKWYLGERPFQYLYFVYLTLGAGVGLKYTVITQQWLGLAGAACLAAAWLVFLAGIKRFKGAWYLAGCIMLYIYTTSATLMTSEMILGPEGPCMAVMCLLILCLTVVFSAHVGKTIRAVFLALTVFVNLYLIDPMPKWVFAGALTEVILLYLIFKAAWPGRWQKALMLILPHLAYYLLVVAPERRYKDDFATDDRIFIEYEQMAYTHFDLLVQDKNNFPLPEDLQDSMVRYLHEAQKAQPDFMIGYNADYMMWGNASNKVVEYYKGNFDSVGWYYKRLNYILVTRYPMQLAQQILKQLCIFYLPNKYAHLELSQGPVTETLYNQTLFQAQEFDQNLAQNLHGLKMENPEMPKYFLAPHYPQQINESGVTYIEKQPRVLKETCWFYRWFNYIFLTVMLLFFVILYCRKQWATLNLITLLYVLIFIYACTVGIVHTFDVGRFVVTVLPFYLVVTFMASAQATEPLKNRLLI